MITVNSWDLLSFEPQGKDSLQNTPVLSQDEAFQTLLNEQLSGSEKAVEPQEDEGINVLDLLDIINPLQHIPVLNYAYRALTGDTIKPISRIMGGALFAGAIGAASALVTNVLEEGTGRSLPENLTALASGDNITEKMKRYEIASNHFDANYDYNV